MRFTLKVSGCLAALAIGVALSSTADVAWAQDAQETVEEVAKAAVAEEAGAEGPNPLAIDPDLAIWTLVVFLVMFAVLKTFAWPQIAAAVDERERRIAATVADADARLADAKRILAEHDAKLAATAGEIRAMLDEARRDADVTKRRIEEEGRKAAADEVARAVREIDRAKDAALQDLAVTSANLAIELGQKVVRDQLQTSPEHQARIVREALSKLGAATVSKN